MKQALERLKDYGQRTDAATIAIQLWNPGDRLADNAKTAVALVLMGERPA